MSATGIDVLYRFLEAFNNAVIEIGRPSQVPIKAVHKLVKVRRVTQEALDVRQECVNNLVEHYGSEDVNGNKSVSPDKFGWDAFQKAMKDLDYGTSVHVDVEPFKSSELDSWYSKKAFPNYANILYDLKGFVIYDNQEEENETPS